MRKEILDPVNNVRLEPINDRSRGSTDKFTDFCKVKVLEVFDPFIKLSADSVRYTGKNFREVLSKILFQLRNLFIREAEHS